MVEKKRRYNKQLTTTKVIWNEKYGTKTVLLFLIDSFCIQKGETTERRGERLLNAQVYSAWFSLSDAEMLWFEESSEQQKDRCASLLVKIGETLKRIQGGLSWQQLASSIRGTGVPIARSMSIARTIMSLPDSCYTTTRIFPLLNEVTKQKRLEWSLNFWVFWTTVKSLTNVKVLLVHMDEKWFYSVGVRNKNKFVPFLGMQDKLSSSV